MARTRLAPAAGDKVLVINPESSYIGRTGTVLRIRGQKAPYQAVIQLDDRADGPSPVTELVLMRDEVMRTELVTVGMAREIERQRIALEAQRMEENEAALARYRARRLARYIESRDKGITDCHGAAEFRVRNELGENVFLDVDAKIRGHTYFSEGITGRVGTSFGDFEASINWDAYGSVKPEQALKFAETLAEAARRVMKFREEMEAREGIVYNAPVHNPTQDIAE